MSNGRAVLLARESWMIAVSRPVLSLLVAAIAMGVYVATLHTAGQGAAAERDVVAAVDSAGARTIVLSDPSSRAGLSVGGIRGLQELTQVAQVTALGPITDVVADGSAGRRPVPAPSLLTPLPDAVSIVGGRHPEVDEAIVGAGAFDRLGLADGAGAVVDADGVRVALVGTFRAGPSLAHLNDMVLLRRDPQPGDAVRSVHVVTRTVQDVALVERAAPVLMKADDQSLVEVESPSLLVDLQEVVRGEVGATGRRTMLLVLLVGLGLVLAVAHFTIAVRRAELGRRRALGASRNDLVVLVLAPVGVSAAAGIVTGTVVSVASLRVAGAPLPPASFFVGVGVLTLLAALFSTIPAAVAASRRDPVAVLRVP